MKLIGDTGGKWPRVQDSVAQDFATIQRQFNLLQQTVGSQASLIAALQAKLANPNLAVSSTNAVTGLANPSSRGLLTVAHDTSLTGLGTPASPLHVVPTSTLGALSVATGTIAQAAFINCLTTPVLLVPGIANASIGILGWGLRWSKVGAGSITAQTVTPQNRVAANGSTAAPSLSPVFNSANNPSNGYSFAGATSFNRIQPPTSGASAGDALGASVYLVGNANGTVTPPATITVSFFVLYYAY